MKIGFYVGLENKEENQKDWEWEGEDRNGKER